MENASKALLIAGAILICIVLISVGMIIVNSTTDVTDQVGEISSTQAAQSFNTQFSKYAGSQKGSSVKSLLEAVATNNGNTAASKKINVYFKDIKNPSSTGNYSTTDTSLATTAGSGLNGSATANDITKAMSLIVNTKEYTVTMSKMSGGYITEITIEDNEA